MAIKNEPVPAMHCGLLKEITGGIQYFTSEKQGNNKTPESPAPRPFYAKARFSKTKALPMKKNCLRFLFTPEECIDDGYTHKRCMKLQQDRYNLTMLTYPSGGRISLSAIFCKCKYVYN